MSDDANKYAVPTDQSLFPTNYKKARVNYSVSEDVVHDFNQYAKDESLNKSGVVEKLLIQFLKNVGVRR